MNLVARNLNNVVFVLDLTRPGALSLVVEHIKQFVGRGIPVRFGVVPVVGASSEDNSLQTLMAQVIWYLTDALGRAPTMQFLATLLKASPESTISEDLLKRAYLQLAATASHVDGGPLARFSELRHYGIGRRAGGSHSRLTKTREYLKRLGVPLAAAAETKKSLGAFFMNGAYFPIDDVSSSRIFSADLHSMLTLASTTGLYAKSAAHARPAHPVPRARSLPALAHRRHGRVVVLRRPADDVQTPQPLHLPLARDEPAQDCQSRRSP